MSQQPFSADARPVRWGRWLVIVVLALFAASTAWTVLTRDISYVNYSRIRVGAPLSSAEFVLGPSKEISARGVPSYRDPDLPMGHPDPVKPVVKGARYFIWTARYGFAYIVIATDENSTIVDKAIFIPSL